MSTYFQHYGNGTNLDLGTIELLSCFLTIPSSLVISSLADKYRAHYHVYLSFITISIATHLVLMLPPIFKVNQIGNKTILLSNDETKFEYSDIEFVESQGKSSWFYLIATCMLIKNLSFRVVMTLNSAFSSNYATKADIPLGSIRFWGSVGLLSGSIALIFINGIKSVAFLLPQLIAYFLVESCQCLTLVFWPNKQALQLFEPTSNQEELYHQNFPTFHYTHNNLNRKRTIKSCRDDLRLAFESKYDHIQYDQKPFLLSSIKVTEFDSTSSNDDSTTCSSEHLNSISSDELIAEEHSLCMKSLDDEETTYNNKDKKRLKNNWKILFVIVTSNKRLLRYLVVFVLFGCVFASNMTYWIPNLKQIYGQDFLEITSYLFFAKHLAELVFFYFTPFIRKHLSQSNCITIVMIGSSIKFAFFVMVQAKISIFYIIAIEVAGSPLSGMFFCAINEIAMEFALESTDYAPILAKKGLIPNLEQDVINQIRDGFKASIVTLCGRTFDSIGFGLGSLIGGWIIDREGYGTLWMLCSLVAGFCTVFNLIFDVREYMKNKKESNEKDSAYKNSGSNTINSVEM